MVTMNVFFRMPILVYYVGICKLDPPLWKNRFVYNTFNFGESFTITSSTSLIGRPSRIIIRSKNCGNNMLSKHAR